MTLTPTQQFWSDIGSQKNFTDPFFLDEFSNYVNKEQLVVEYGCGYGRILHLLHESGYKNVKGFDFAPKMIERGQALFPELDLALLKESAKIPLQNQTADAVILSTVLCCNPHLSDQRTIIQEIRRLLKPQGLLYLIDFLITPSYFPRYVSHPQESPDFGVYTTSEGIPVRHHQIAWFEELLQDFTVLWKKEGEYITMNGNPVNTLHLFANVA